MSAGVVVCPGAVSVNVACVIRRKVLPLNESIPLCQMVCLFLLTAIATILIFCTAMAIRNDQRCYWVGNIAAKIFRVRTPEFIDDPIEVADFNELATLVDAVLGVEGCASRRNGLPPAGRSRVCATCYEWLISVRVSLLKRRGIIPSVVSFGLPAVNIGVIEEINIPRMTARAFEPEIFRAGIVGPHSGVLRVIGTCQKIGITKVRVEGQPIEHIVLASGATDGLFSVRFDWKRKPNTGCRD